MRAIYQLRDTIVDLKSRLEKKESECIEAKAYSVSLQHEIENLETVHTKSLAALSLTHKAEVEAGEKRAGNIRYLPTHIHITYVYHLKP